MASYFQRAIDRLKSIIEESFDPAKEFQRFEVSFPAMDLLVWLSTQTSSWRFYFSTRDASYELAASGQLKEFFSQSMREILHEIHPARCYGAACFDESTPTMTLPRLEISRRGADFFLACYVLDGDSLQAFAALDDLCFCMENRGCKPLKLLKEQTQPDFQGWKKNVEKAYELFSEGECEKIVLCRKTEFFFSDACDPFLFLKNLQTHTKNSIHFCVQRQGSPAFLGASPERLYAREKNKVFSEAIAGTRKRSKSLDEDQQLGLALLSSNKDRTEQRIVFQHLREIFSKFCVDVLGDEQPRLLKGPFWQHLKSTIQGTLRQGVEDFELIRQLHPTPAVGGFPKEGMPEKIRKIEGFDRQYYAGVLGWCARDCAEFAVAIRSGFLYADRLVVYSGAGIVNGSDPHEEWLEVQMKLSHFLAAINNLGRVPCR